MSTDPVRDALEYAAEHFSSDWPERCQLIVLKARAALVQPVQGEPVAWSETPAVGSQVDRHVRPPATGPNMRRMLRAARLCEELGHAGDTLAALQHMQRMQSALRVLHTWAAFPPLDVRQVRELCAHVLKADETA